MIFRTLLLICFCSSSLLGQEYLKIKVAAGDNTNKILKRYRLSAFACNMTAFKTLNGIKDASNLMKGKSYKLPIQVYTYNGRSIRTTIGITNYEKAKRIQDYNEQLVKDKLKRKDYRTDKVLWVPHHEVKCGKKITPSVSTTVAKPLSLPKKVVLAPDKAKGIYPIYGEKYKKIKIKDNSLKGKIYYIVSGHGGPDPGAVNRQKDRKLCEDEYAYDISLRLARNLMEKGATVYIIVRDPNDGIRDDGYLRPDKDERTYGDLKMPYNSKQRLFQRSNAINRLFLYHKSKGVSNDNQIAVMLHIDSRSVEKRMDIFFYYFPGSSKGRAIAKTLQSTIRGEYQKHQKNRGYGGTVRSRDLHMLRETKPMAVYVELGNIRNAADLRRFVVTSNRQALANWLAKGIVKIK